MLKVEKQCLSKILSQNYLASKFNPAGIPAQTGKMACPQFKLFCS